MDEALIQVKLKKVSLQDAEVGKAQAQARAQAAAFFDMKDDYYHNTILDFNIEQWYEQLRAVTPHTEFLPITLQDAQVIEAAYDALEIKQESVLSEELKAKLKAIESKLETVIERVKKIDNADGVFVKSSSRSAKDRSVASPAFRTHYRKFLSEHKEPSSLNAKLIALQQAGTEILKCSSANDVIETFCHSERIHSDFEIAAKVPERWVENFVIRRWVPIDVRLEFRCFAIGTRLTAISQYCSLIYVPELQERRQHFIDTILQFHQTNVASQLAATYGKYVVDYGFLLHSDTKLVVIEVNPFLPTTDAALFDWTKDFAILTGAAEMEFRCVTKEPRGKAALGGLLDSWRAVLEDEEKLALGKPAISPAAATPLPAPAPAVVAPAVVAPAVVAPAAPIVVPLE